MKNRPIHLLGIAPYDSMKTALKKAAADRADIEIDVYTGNLEEGVAIARDNLQTNYDAIISRGGTAELIGRITHIPVIEISLSVYDILRAMKLAQNYTDRYAIVGFPSITENAHLLCSLLRYQIDIVTIHNENEVLDTLTRLKENGYSMIVCDVITNNAARHLGLNSILITSGQESIESALDQAVKICSSYVDLKEENSLLHNIIDGSTSDIIVFDSNENLYMSTWKNPDADGFYELLKKDIPKVLNEDYHKTFKNVNDTLYSITGKIYPYLSSRYTAFYCVSSGIPMLSGKYGIQFTNRKDAEKKFSNSFYNIQGSMGDIQDSILQISQSDFPVMITGEQGTGKEQIARVIYTQSKLNKNPLVTIDCGLMNDKSWGYLTNHYNSPLNDNQNTLYFQGIEELSSERQKHLLSIILDMDLCRRNKVIISCVCDKNETMPAAGIVFLNRLSCLSIHLPPLRDRLEELPAFSSLYLADLNVELGKQIIGFEPNAMDLLQHYDWPYNYTQFKQILTELVVLTDTPYIQTSTVRSTLEQAKATLTSEMKNTANGLQLDLNRSLEEINNDIIQHVLKESGGNQTLAAQKLQISRTTLWRYLNRKE
ncbi:PrpR N-terminal domain-containing protein [Anaerobium acetethylicum]|uniref:Regulatory protein, Fis family n=1 Tax=Anaerobium acetethylicum TaxID=1619234 RepID=A0A1D3TWY6_9FIRM|nr:sigma-54-dependent transcriptional regulator [Anaerobium acetethylicum]SCP98796.1 regulatory protein, Fis family [Anaerobium acetethylicum]